ncbi:MAG: nucleotide sugar dehydrogenase [Nitrospiraceae bacterium]|nr:nucleotide sugar dehydrogenase [Nitrospiraceae bacterium]
MKKGNKRILKELSDAIGNKKATVGVIGLGYVGIPLAIVFNKAGFSVRGFDVDPRKIPLLRRGRSYLRHIPSGEIRAMNETGRFVATDDFSLIRNTDCICLCVPTPLDSHHQPDLSYVINTAKTVGRYLRPGHLIVLESTTYPGTTQEEVRPILESNGLRAGRDFFLAYSPEREDPNNPRFSTRTIPKVVGGCTKSCLQAAGALYRAVVETVVPVSSMDVAEAAKLLENIYRSVNIALVNELKVCFDRMGIDVWEVIGAAKTKPFGFQAFYPGPGLGGHCIPIDPFYLTWKAREFDFHTRFIELAGEINTAMPYYVVSRLGEALNSGGKGVKGSRILVLGLAYKKDVDDVRESPSLKLIELLRGKGAKVDYHDPYVPKTRKSREYDLRMTSVPLTAANLGKYDCVLISTDHSVFDYDFIVRHSRLVVDTRNATAGMKSKKIVKA